jgi:hypothetical protein
LIFANSTLTEISMAFAINPRSYTTSVDSIDRLWPGKFKLHEAGSIGEIVNASFPCWTAAVSIHAQRGGWAKPGYFTS